MVKAIYKKNIKKKKVINTKKGSYAQLGIDFKLNKLRIR